MVGDLEEGLFGNWVEGDPTRSRLGLASLCAYAFDFLEAARNVSATKEGAFRPARFYLLCHALELALRAYMLLIGQNPDARAAPVARHDLRSLFAEAEACGLGRLVQFTPQGREQIEKAALYYSEAVFEYPALAEALRGYPEIPDFDALVGLSATLCAGVRVASAVVIQQEEQGNSRS